MQRLVVSAWHRSPTGSPAVGLDGQRVEIFVLGIHHGILGYIGHDRGCANQIPKTLDNAVDSAAALYMDIINLFLRILRILGRK